MRPLNVLALALAALGPVGAAGAAAGDGAATQLSWYGYLRLDMAHDSAVTSAGNYALFVQPHVRGDEIPTLSVTARQTRVGARIERGTMKGHLEVDFYGTSPENKNTVMLRYAYATVPVGPFTLEAGQSADLFSPLVPLTVNYTVAWGVGNVGYRRPQMKLYRSAGRLYLGASLARNITGDLDGDAIVDGEASGLPAVQGRCAITPLTGAATATVGLSGHYGRCTCPKADKDYANWSANADATLARGRWKLLGEVYLGQNMGPYAGAIYHSDTVGGVGSGGGWANLQFRQGRLALTTGGGLDDVDAGDVATLADARVRNQVAWLGGLWRLTPEVTVGLEVSRWATRYANRSPGTQTEPASRRLHGTLQADF